MSSAASRTAFTAEFASTYKDMMLGQIEREHKITRRIIAAIPDQRLDYKHDAGGRTALELADHIVTSELWFLNSIADGTFDTKASSPLTSRDEILARYDREFPAAMARAKKCSGEHLIKVTDVSGARIPTFRYIQFCQDHTVHHRGQLSTLLRPMGGEVPEIYSGGADDPHLEGA